MVTLCNLLRQSSYSRIVMTTKHAEKGMSILKDFLPLEDKRIRKQHGDLLEKYVSSLKHDHTVMALRHTLFFALFRDWDVYCDA